VAGAVWTCGESTAPEVSRSPQAQLFLQRGVFFGGTLYVIFMATVDVPMYISRSLADFAQGRRFLSFSEGVQDISKCAVVTASDEYWKEEYPWMTAYFSGAVWAMLWLAHAKIKPARAPAAAAAAPAPAAAAAAAAGAGAAAPRGRGSPAAAAAKHAASPAAPAASPRAGRGRSPTPRRRASHHAGTASASPAPRATPRAGAGASPSSARGARAR
jgi:hypothetical protein